MISWVMRVNEWWVVNLGGMIRNVLIIGIIEGYNEFVNVVCICRDSF